MSDTETAVDDLGVGSPLPDEIDAKTAPEEKPVEEAEEKPSEDEPDAAATTQEEGEDSPEEKEDRPSKTKRKGDRRLRNARAGRLKAEREAAQLKQQLEALQSRAEPEAEPKQDDFQSFDEFVLARAEFRARETVRKELETAGQNIQQTQNQAVQAAREADWSLKVEDARDKYDDFDDVAQNPDLPVTPSMAMAIQDSDNGADVAYHLGNNPRLAQEIAALSDVQAVLRIGQLSQKLAEKPRPKPTATPDPPKPLKTTTATPQKSPEDMSYEEYVEWRRKGGK